MNTYTTDQLQDTVNASWKALIDPTMTDGERWAMRQVIDAAEAEIERRGTTPAPVSGGAHDLTTERCETCHGIGEVPSGYDRFASGLMAWRVCPRCDGAGTVAVATAADGEAA